MPLLAGLSGWALSEERGTDLLSMNKEGLVSVLGYWALHLLGVGLGWHLGSTPTLPQSPLIVWCALDVALWALLVFLELAVEPRSRRSCNAAYVVWTAAMCISLLLPLMVAQVRVSWRGGAGGGTGGPGATGQRLTYGAYVS